MEEEARDEERGKSGHAPSIVGCVRQPELCEVSREAHVHVRDCEVRDPAGGFLRYFIQLLDFGMLM